MEKYLFLIGVFATIVVGQKPNFPNSFQQNFPNLEDSFSKNLTFVISGSDLPSGTLDTIDPFLKLYQTNKTNIEPEKFATSEVKTDSPNPEFNDVFTYLWKKGNDQKLIIKVKDQDPLKPDVHVGEVTVDMDEYVAKGEKLNVSLPEGGSLLIQKTTPKKFKLYARNLPRMDPFSGKSDPYVKCYWSRGVRGELIKFYTTQVLDNLENADWDEVIEFPNYIKGTDIWWTFKVRDSDGLSDDDLGEALVEVDPFLEKKVTKELKLGATGKATLGIIPLN